MAKQQNEKQGKKATKKTATKKATKRKPPAIRDGICKACGRFIRVVGTGRCECGQAYLIRGGKLARINETPNGCVQGLPEAATLKQAEQVKTEAETLAEPKPEPKAKRKRADGKMSGLDAAAQVLSDAGEPLGTKVMVERMLDQGLWATNGKTPAATIYAAMTREIKKKGAESRFEKVGRGTFALAE
ncbi:MAG: winged helix-turn-helix domain-containing protein [Planctomycetota bacterium]